ncbi:Putative periplasmic protein TonB [Elusimicrobium minutum Pei191]|uniref:Putative periplasmic protein TonB n=1 Tax=Elusimicrobium minutum (strain Pei191) TaxID=445932 RepID=B2KBI0_ELUMP|nr:TonB family protein [Elusimicrobium minutum]ACC98002.1 Putative periplasmic protein TonB [Elusimicrobium minutum Pei191]
MFNRYFFISGVLHALMAGFLFFVIMPASVKKPLATYTIDFLGASFQAPADGSDSKKSDEPTPTPAAPKEEAKKEEIKKPETPVADKKAYAAKSQITTKPQPAPKKKIVLGTPSILADNEKEKKAEAAKTSAKAGSSQGEGDGVGGIKTDFPNFPFPWYITQVRNALWTEWEKRKPKQANVAALVTFAIQRDGSIKNLKVSKASGNELYDYAAKTSVDAAAPFPPLPAEFEKSELTVTVEFKDEN